MDGGANSAENMIEHGIIKRFFVFEIVVEQGLVHAGRPGDSVSARSGNSFLRKFAHRRLQDRCPALFGAASRAHAGFCCDRHLLTNYLVNII